ncbi:neurotrypsin-like [Ruditapes philippinarum]|uniref:neurotrypsin-like n=1 Tax=Ruditapes philippinarum TaxID=129788 RepID=UPI00295C2C20|nr:neurotrypsin-like [Ruditapes philippinarum]
MFVIPFYYILEVPLNITDVRLYNGNEYEGVVQFKKTFSSWYYVPFPKHPEYIDQPQCKGTESHINECTYTIPYSCPFEGEYVRYAAVECTGHRLNISGIRLAGTSGPYHGRVEIDVNGTWGTICDRYVYDYEADAICQMFGLESYSFYHNAYYGEGSGPVYIDELNCYFGQEHINECQYVTEHTCQHRNDVSVMCYDKRKTQLLFLI